MNNFAKTNQPKKYIYMFIYIYISYHVWFAYIYIYIYICRALKTREKTSPPVSRRGKSLETFPGPRPAIAESFGQRGQGALAVRDGRLRAAEAQRQEVLRAEVSGGAKELPKRAGGEGRKLGEGGREGGRKP